MNFSDLKKVISKNKKLTVAVAQARGEALFQALKEASSLCNFLLIGEKIKGYEFLDAKNDEDAAAIAISAIREKKADLLMKGDLPTSVLLKKAFSKEEGLNIGRFISHVAVFEREQKFFGITDGGVNIAPALKEKIAILQNAVELFHFLGIPNPKVGILSATEKETSAIPSSLDAATLREMGKKKEISGCEIFGPISFDLAVSSHARAMKGVPFKEDMDILLVPEIVSGNALAKSLTYLAKYPTGGIVLGAACPIILLSRSDTHEEKYNSLILGLFMQIQKQRPKSS